MKRDSRDVSTVRLRESSVQGHSSTSSTARMTGEVSCLTRADQSRSI
jgi:hypothetical protein